MVLIISGILLAVGIIIFFLGVMIDLDGMMGFGFFLAFFTIIFGFLFVGLALPVETEIIVPDGSFIEKNENSIVLVVPNIGNKVITDPAIIRHIEVGDTIKVMYDYNSYGGELREWIYVEKNGWKY